MTIPPGATIGLLGSGQLGRMFAGAAHQLGYRVHVFSPDADSPAGQVSEQEISSPYDDVDALTKFAQHVDIVTLEFENIPLTAVNAIERFVPVRPGPDVLAAAQNRIVENSSLRKAGLPVPVFATVAGPNDIRTFLSRPNATAQAVLKSAEAGYDGKGQTRVSTSDDAADALSRIGTSNAIVEELVNFQLELSVIGARSPDGHIQCFGPIVNDHQNHILDVSVAPAEGIDPGICAEAIEITRCVLEHFDVTGVLCVEMFLTTDGRLLVNEIAPRPHNSGHLTIEACVTSQFEQQVRTVCGLPLGSMELLRPAAMANLLGDHLAAPTTDVTAALQSPDVKLHLYGKRDPRLKRKMGHITATAATSTVAESLVRAARRAIAGTATAANDGRISHQYTS